MQLRQRLRFGGRPKSLPISTHVTAPFVPFPGKIALLIAKGAFMMRKRVFRSTIATVCATLLAAPAGIAQQSSGQSTGQSASQSAGQSGGGQPAAAPSGGISGGTAPIETTLFAYRALQSNADEIALKIAEARIGDRIVIGAQQDVSAFLQWRTAMGQADLMKSQLDAMHTELTYLNGSYRRATPLASLSIAKTHKGKLVKGASGSYTILVSNSAAASVTAGPVIVSDTPPDGLTIASISGNGWNCDPSSGTVALNSCTRSDPLGPGAVYDPITVKVSIASDAPDNVTNTATVAGGGSATASANDTATLAAAPTGGRGGGAAPHNLFLAPLATDTSSSGTGSGTGSTTPPASPFSTALSAIPTLTSLAQFIATSFAVNQTLSPWQGSMTDMPLINAVAGILRHHGRTVFVPATYPPLTMTDKDLSSTYIFPKITALRDARLALWHDLQKANALLMDANFVIQNPTKYAAADLNDALEYAGKAQSLLTSAQTLAAAVDTFVANLFGTQAPTIAAAPTSAGGGAPASSGSSVPAASSPAPGAAGSALPTSTPGPASTTAAATTSANGGGGGQNAGSVGSTSPPTGISLQQILASDFLAQRIFNFKPNVDMNDINTINFLALHALESGGSELVKTNIFYGTRIFFSGGSVATFSLYRMQGEMQCSGTAFNYTGNVREKDVEHRLMVDDIGHAARVAGFSCADMKDSAHRLVSEGMTRSEVEIALGKPDKTYLGRNLYLYKSRDTVVQFQKGVVNKIMAAAAAQPLVSPQ
jgi:uncharacterized repeat protein (TIGR01451 family)